MWSEPKVQTMLCCALLAAIVGQAMCSYGGGGYSTSKRQQDDWGNYMFAYEIKDDKGNQNYRSEKGDKENNVEGSYGIHDVDGRMRVVDYWADKKNGFVAKIRSNEPGVGHQDSANAIYNGPDGHKHGKDDVDIDHGHMGGKSYMSHGKYWPMLI